MTTKVASVKEMRAIEAAAAESGLSYAQMMLNAGHSASNYLRRRLELNEEAVVVVLVGKGNNGGDGLVMACDLAAATAADIRIYLVEARARDDIHLRAAVDAGLKLALATDDSDGAILENWLGEAAALVDAIYGIGLRLPIRGDSAAVLERITRCLRAEPPFVLALDCPSGVDCDSGAADRLTLRADATISFIAAKPGLLTFPAAAFVGELEVARIGVPATLTELKAVSTTLMDNGLAASLLPPRRLDGHKATFGKVMLVAGSPNYIGVLALAGEAACRSGVGLVTIATTHDLIEVVASSLPEPTWLALNDDDGAISENASEKLLNAAQAYDALLIGCGLGLHKSTREFVSRIVSADATPPLILDADALNALSPQLNWWAELPAGTIITPHPGEMSRLTGLSTAEINSDRWQLSRQYAALWQVVVVLKGAHTVIAHPAGETTVIPVKSDALSTAGTGDILAGLVAGLRAQGLGAYDSARLGAYLHAVAGTIAAERVGSSRSVIAGDVLAALGAAFQRIERH